MKTALNTETFSISITDIAPDIDDSSRLEISFVADLSRAYLDTIFDADTVNDILDDDDNIVFEFNVADRHDDCLYYIIQHDRSGDYYDDYDDAINAYGQPIIDFIDSACKLLNIPFYPNR